MGLQAVSRSQSSSTLTGRQCWSAVLGWLQCALTAVEVASRGLTYSIRCSAGWECSRRKTSWMPSGSWGAICVQHTVNIHQCQHTAARTDTYVLYLLKSMADLDTPDFIETQWYDRHWLFCMWEGPASVRPFNILSLCLAVFWCRSHILTRLELELLGR